MMPAFDAIQAEVARCAGIDDVRLPNGWFVRHLDPDQPLRFLHKIFAPASEVGVAEIEECLGFPPPSQYRRFLAQCGGATLFDRSMHLFGFRGMQSRSLELKDQRPLDISPAIRDFRSSVRDTEYSGWAIIGSLTIFNRICLVINRQGKTALIGEGRHREYDDFDAIIRHVVGVLSAGLGCGPLPKDGDALLEDCLFAVTH